MYGFWEGVMENVKVLETESNESTFTNLSFQANVFGVFDNNHKFAYLLELGRF